MIWKELTSEDIRAMDKAIREIEYIYTSRCEIRELIIDNNDGFCLNCMSLEEFQYMYKKILSSNLI